MSALEKTENLVRMEKKTIDAINVIGQACVDNSCTMDDILGKLVQDMAKGAYSEKLQELFDKAPKAGIPANMPVAPTKDNIDTISSL